MPERTEQERPALAGEPRVTNTLEAGVRGVLELVCERRFAAAVRATAQPNPALEVCDVIQVCDGTLGATVCLITQR